MKCDELWSFVKVKCHKQWIWLALARQTWEIVGVARGDRSERTAKQLWDSLPGVYRQGAVSHTDFGAAYSAVFPVTHHRTHRKKPGQTNPIERFNCTLRQRISRLVRKTLSFSKKRLNHLGAIWNFIHHYNASLITGVLIIYIASLPYILKVDLNRHIHLVSYCLRH